MTARHTTQNARSWRDIPQQGSPRALSSEGRRRALLRVLKTVGIVVVVGALAWGGIQVAGTFREGAKPANGAAQSAPVKDLVLVTDGVLNQTWLSKTLALPKNTSLMALDLFQLRNRVTASGQVRSATLTRSFPATLAVNLSERAPVARLSAQDRDGDVRTLLVARDGVVYDGVGYDAAMIGTLP
jgi:cell division protein FtsQ